MYADAASRLPEASDIVIFTDNVSRAKRSMWIRRLRSQVWFWESHGLDSPETIAAMGACTHHIPGGSVYGQRGIDAAAERILPLIPAVIRWKDGACYFGDAVLGEEARPPLVSVCIPAYEMHGKGVEFLEKAVESVLAQAYPNKQIIVSDHSVTDDVEVLCRTKWPTAVAYLRNVEGRGSGAANVNNAINFAAGAVIKPLFQDDFLGEADCLEQVVGACAGGRWCAVACMHTNADGLVRHWFHVPTVPSNPNSLLRGVNSIGCPSVVAWPAIAGLRFDTSTINLMDTEMYFNLLRKIGPPVLLKDKPFVIVRAWEGSVTSTTVTDALTTAEASFLFGKHGIKEECT